MTQSTPPPVTGPSGGAAPAVPAGPPQPRPSRGARLAIVLVSSIGLGLLTLGAGLGALLAHVAADGGFSDCVVLDESDLRCLDSELVHVDGVIDRVIDDDTVSVSFTTQDDEKIVTRVEIADWAAYSYDDGDDVEVAYSTRDPRNLVTLDDELWAPLPGPDSERDGRATARTVRTVFLWITGIALVGTGVALIAGIPWVRRAPRRRRPAAPWAWGAAPFTPGQYPQPGGYAYGQPQAYPQQPSYPQGYAQAQYPPPAAYPQAQYPQAQYPQAQWPQPAPGAAMPPAAPPTGPVPGMPPIQSPAQAEPEDTPPAGGGFQPPA